MTRDYMTPFEHHQKVSKTKVEYADEKEDVYRGIDYVKLPWARDVLNQSEKQKRAAEVSPLLKEWIEKNENKARGKDF